MKTKVEPTVEKCEMYLDWGEDMDGFESHVVKGHKLSLKTDQTAHLHCSCGATWSDPTRSLSHLLGECFYLSHSLQEAKAEERERIKQAVSKLYGKEKYATEHYHRDGTCDICGGQWGHFEDCDYAIYRQTKQTLDSVLSTLNKKEEK